MTVVGAAVPETVIIVTATKERFEAPIVCFADTGVFVSSERALPFREEVELHFSSVSRLPVIVEVVATGLSGMGFELPDNAPVAMKHIFENWSHGKDAATTDLNVLMPPPPKPPPRPTSRPENGPKVLVVDDDPAIREMLRRALTHLGCQVYLAPGAMEGIELLGRHPIDAVLLDWLMPKASGEVVLEAKKQLKHTARVAVMSAVTTSGPAQQKMRMLGAETVFSKPFRIGRIVQWIKER